MARLFLIRAAVAERDVDLVEVDGIGGESYAGDTTLRRSSWIDSVLATPWTSVTPQAAMPDKNASPVASASPGPLGESITK